MSASFIDKTSTISSADKDREAPESEQSSWQTFATFVVSLQSRQEGEQSDQRTIVYFLEADRRKIWPGIECNDVYEFMQDQLKQVLPLDPRDTTSTKSTTESQPQAAVEIASNTKNVSQLTEQSPESLSDVSVEKLTPKLNGEEHFSEPESLIFPQADSNPQELLELPDEENLDSLAEVSVPIDVEEDSESLHNVASESLSEEILGSSETDENSESVAEGELPPEGKSPPDEEFEEPVTLKITHLKVHQPLEAKECKAADAADADADAEDTETEKVMVIDATKRALLDKLPKEKPFDLDVIFHLSGTGALELTKQSLPYYAEVYGQNRITRHKLALGRAPVGRLVNGKLMYTCRLSEMTLSQPGSYSLQIITRLGGASVSPDFLELPFVQVA